MARLLFDVSNMNDARRTGIGRLTENLLRSSALIMESGQWTAGQLTCVSAWPFRLPGDDLARFRALGIRFQHLPTPSMYLYRFLRLPSFARRQKADLLVIPEPTVFPYPRCPRYTVLLNDLIHIDDRPSMSWHIALIYRTLADRTLRGAASIGAISEFTRHRAEAHLPGIGHKTHLIPMVCDLPPVDEDPSPESAEAFALFVGNLIPRKNIRRLVRVFARWKKKHPREFVPLVVVGKPNPRVDHIAPFLEKAERRGIVRRTGYVTDEELRRLYRTALFFVFPSLYEGYGLPILEAMSHGCPVLTSAGTATGEAAGGAAELVDPESDEALLGALRRLRADQNRRDELRSLGYARVAELTHERQGHAFQRLLLAGLG